LAADFGESEEEESETEKDDMKKFIFDTTSIVDVDALENYVR